VLTLLVPAMNEEITVGEFVDWCLQGIRESGYPGEVLIVDSSSDRTAEIALAHGARVLRTPKRGLGRAYIDAIPHVRGRWVVMGDADLTYDFRELRQFTAAFEQGAEFIMGSRFKGGIEPRAMPALHRYFGTPVTTSILNLIYGTRFSDIHCGMRGVTIEALRRMRLRSDSWQYASEMIIKAVHLGLRSAEVPVKFHKDREGRQSHLKRIGWTAPWVAGWLTLQAFFTYGADFFLFLPGLAMSLLGGLGVAALSFGPRVVAGVGLSLHWMLLFLVAFIAGLNFLFTGMIARVLYDEEAAKAERRRRMFHLNRAIPTSIFLEVLGAGFALPLVLEYVKQGYRLPEALGIASYQAVAGLALMLAGFTFFTASLVINAALSRSVLAVKDTRT
jgi:glycosyltransferase involved in cell wall biosynthesis